MRRVVFLTLVCLGLATFLGSVACLVLAIRLIFPPVATFSGHTGPVYYVVSSPDGNTLASVSSYDKETPGMNGDKTIRLWNVAARTERAILPAHSGDVRHLVFSPNSRTLAC